MTYETWRESVIRILTNQRLIRLSTKMAPDIYLPYFEDGYTPAKAIKEDMGEDAIRYWGEVEVLP